MVLPFVGVPEGECITPHCSFPPVALKSTGPTVHSCAIANDSAVHLNLREVSGAVPFLSDRRFLRRDVRRRRETTARSASASGDDRIARRRPFAAIAERSR